MPYYRAVGDVPGKQHTVNRQPRGGLYAEELMAVEGFSGDGALLYHRHVPTAIIKAEAVAADADSAGELATNLPLLPRHFRTHQLPSGGDAVTGRRLLLANADVRLSYVAADAPNDLYRNVTGDELVYVEAGTATLESVYGVLAVRGGDYVVIPAGTTHRFVPREGEGLRALVVETRGHVSPPARYRSKSGQFLEHAPLSTGSAGTGVAAERRRWRDGGCSSAIGAE
jgi:homogentisate 1,2-dioxygenase